MAETSFARAYSAACPNCGAPVEFRSAASVFAVCGFCRSTLVRGGADLRRIGASAELFDDFSPLQLGASGRYQGQAFTLIGRLQYRYADGTWNEWHALFDGGAREGEGARAGSPQKPGWLAEDNGAYVVAFDAPLKTPVPPAERLRPGAPLTVNGQSWSVASVVAARLIAAEGELPRRPERPGEFFVADLRSGRGEVATLDYGEPQRPGWSVGRSVELADLAMTGLAAASEKTLSGRSLACPNCGAALQVKLDSTQSIVCRQCESVVDVSEGVGGDLAHYAQGKHAEPAIALGSVGRIALGMSGVLPWQVVGYTERSEVAESSDDEPSSWREYLLWHRLQGFAFLVDTDEGWSSAVPITGAPQAAGNGVRHEGVVYRKLYDYTSRVDCVLGEFYWRVERHQRTRHSDYQGLGQAATKRLNREETKSAGAAEVVWSAGETLAADTVAAAFGIAPAARGAFRRDASPTAFGGTPFVAKFFFWSFVVVVALLLFRCGDGAGVDCGDTRQTFGEASQEYQNCLDRQRSGGGYRGGGGAFGGYSSGGGHK